MITDQNWDSERWPNFSPDELRCKHTGALQMEAEFLDRLQRLRRAIGKPLRVTSGYRHPTHPVEARKKAPGTHSKGCAVDIGCDGRLAHEILKEAFAAGFTGIGVSQKSGGARFVHVDSWEEGSRPNAWSY